MTKSDEVEIPGDDYEVIPLTPLRRIEKRLEAIETTKTMGNLERFIDKTMDMVELNQKIIDEVVRANQGLREDVSVLVGKMDNTQAKMAELVDIIKEAGEGEDEEKNTVEDMKNVMVPLINKIDDMNQKTIESNAAIVEALSAMDKRMKRMQTGGVPKPAANILTRRRGMEQPPVPGQGPRTGDLRKPPAQ